MSPFIVTFKSQIFDEQGPQTSSSPVSGGMSFQEAVQIEQEAHAQDLARQRHAEERKRRLGLPVKGEVLSRQEIEARMWAFMQVPLYLTN